MANRRILSLWFPRLGAERLLRGLRNGPESEAPLAVIDTIGNTEKISSLSLSAAALGLRRGQSLRDACAICPDLLTRRRNRHAEARFLQVLARWAGQASPWVARDGEDGLILDVTGCAHLFGDETGMIAHLSESAAHMGVSLRAGLADTRGGAWALARFAGQTGGSERSGDAIDMEARATRARAGKRRHWERGGAAPGAQTPPGGHGQIAPKGALHRALSPLPVAALRLDEATRATLSRLGLRRIGDLIGQPRASLARRFGQGLVLRLDQAMGAVPEPVSPEREADHFALRLTLPEPIGLSDDVVAAVDRLLPPLCAKLQDRGMAARTLALEAHRADHTMQRLEVRLARPSHTPDRLRGLLVMKLDDLDAGFGIDMLRLIAIQVEPAQQRAPVGHVGAGAEAAHRLAADTGVDDLIGRIGARVGIETITRRHPSESHLPEKSAQILAAAFSAPAASWRRPVRPRPLRLWRPEAITTLPDAPRAPRPPQRFRWRRRDLVVAEARGPERIAPEWWLDDPEWRAGLRDYWDVVTEDGDRLWIFFAHGAAMSAGWFCHGQFA